MKKMVLTVMIALVSANAMAADVIYSKRVAKSQAAAVPVCNNTSIKGDYILQLSAVKSGESLSGTYTVFFDGGNEGKFSISGTGGNIGDLAETTTGISYSVDESCSTFIEFTLPNDNTTVSSILYLDRMITTKKPYIANHATGQFFSGSDTAESLTYGTATLQNWLERK
jgi:hypothetical protein